MKNNLRNDSTMVHEIVCIYYTREGMMKAPTIFEIFLKIHLKGDTPQKTG